jgi:hypothetical protein
MPIILATQEAGTRRIVVQSQPRQIVCKTLPQKTHHKKRTGRVAQVVEHLPRKYEALNSNPGDKERQCIV